MKALVTLQLARSFDVAQALDQGPNIAMAEGGSPNCKMCPLHPYDEAAPILCHWCAFEMLVQCQKDVKQLQAENIETKAQNEKLLEKVDQQGEQLKKYNKAHNTVARQVRYLCGLAARMEEICPILCNSDKTDIQCSKRPRTRQD